MVLKTTLVQPGFGDLSMSFCSGSKEGDDMSFIKPPIDDFQCVRVKRTIHHPLRFLVRDVITYGAVYINKVVLDLCRKQRTEVFSLFICNRSKLRIFRIMTVYFTHIGFKDRD